MNDTIVFGGGCFWCTEAVFKMLKGVVSVEPGYAGGSEGAAGPEQSEGQGGDRGAGGPERSEGQRGPTYEEVCSGTTGHAEVIKIEYDSAVIMLEDLLTVFFATHDSTTKNRQDYDVGTQYRSIILYTTNDQKETVEKFIEELNSSSKQGRPITTEVKVLDKFYPAEDYHKNYYENNKNQGYCQVIINPKLKKVQEKFVNLLKEN